MANFEEIKAQLNAAIEGQGAGGAAVKPTRYVELRSLETTDPELYQRLVAKLRAEQVAARGLPWPVAAPRDPAAVSLCGCPAGFAYLDHNQVWCCARCEKAEGEGWKDAQAERFTPRELDAEQRRGAK